jgi:hypothetical protein
MIESCPSPSYSIVKLYKNIMLPHNFHPRYIVLLFLSILLIMQFQSKGLHITLI